MNENQGLASQKETIQYLDTLNYKQLLDTELLQKKFIDLYNNIHGQKNGDIVFAKVKFDFQAIIAGSEKLQKCTALSLYSVFMEVAARGLTLERGSKPLCYIFSRGAKVQKNGQNIWEERAYLELSPYGELSERMRLGQIKYVDNPVIVYDCDLHPTEPESKFKVGLDSQKKLQVINYVPEIPRPKDAKIVGGFIRIERHDNSFSTPWFDVSEADRWACYSNKQNRGSDTEDKANALYKSYNGQIDPGFFEAKIIKHCFDAYPKIPTNDAVSTSDEYHTIDVNHTEVKPEPQALMPSQESHTLLPQATYIHGNMGGGEYDDNYKEEPKGVVIDNDDDF